MIKVIHVIRIKENLISGFHTVYAIHYFVKETLNAACRLYKQGVAFGNHFSIWQFNPYATNVIYRVFHDFRA